MPTSVSQEEYCCGDEKTPFACVTFFDVDFAVSNLTAGSVAALTAALDRELPSTNLVYALRLEGVDERGALVPVGTQPDERAAGLLVVPLLCAGTPRPSSRCCRPRWCSWAPKRWRG